MMRSFMEPPQRHVHQSEVFELNDLIIGMKLIAEADHGYDAWSRHEFAMSLETVATHIQKCYRHGRNAETYESVSDMWDTHKRSSEYLAKLAKSFEDGTAKITDDMILECERICHEIEGCTESMIKY